MKEALIDMIKTFIFFFLLDLINFMTFLVLLLIFMAIVNFILSA